MNTNKIKICKITDKLKNIRMKLYIKIDLLMIFKQKNNKIAKIMINLKI